jgi:succinoglycan biosynthesis protein ExoA
MNKLPLISVIMPIRNEADYIAHSLNAVMAQDFPFNRIEIFVVDGMSSDGTRQILQEYAKEYPNLHLVDNPGRIVPTGFNTAITLARGTIIIRIDGHTLIDPDYVRQCIDALYNTGADNVGGKMNAVGISGFGEAVALATSSPFGVGGGRFHYSDKKEWVDTVYMGAWRREIFDRIGLFDEELVRDQDDEFNYRLREQGGKILLSPKIKSTYTVRSKPRSLWRQYFQYGYWKVRVLQKHPRQMRPRQFIPPAFAGVLLFSTLLAVFTFSGRLLLGIILGSYLLANLTASTYTAAQKGWRHLPLLPIVYAILHLSYGLGFLTGLVKFWNRWTDKTGRVPSWKPSPVE